MNAKHDSNFGEKVDCPAAEIMTSQQLEEQRDKCLEAGTPSCVNELIESLDSEDGLQRMEDALDICFD